MPRPSFRDGRLCYLSCGALKHLTGFTAAGVGVATQYLLDHPPDEGGRTCVWIVDPYNTRNNTINTSINLNTTLHFQINSFNLRNSSLLIYSNLPTFLQFTDPNSIFNGSISTNQITRNVRTNLLVSLTGEQLSHAATHTTVNTNLVTLVYNYHDTGLTGFELNVSIIVENNNSTIVSMQTLFD